MSWKSTSTTNPALLLRAQIPRRNIGQIAHVSTTPSITSQEADITRRAPEVACWLRLGCWSNNSANSRSSAGVFRRVLCSCLVPQSSHLCDGARIVTWEITYKWKIDFLAKYITTGEYIYNHARWTLLLLVILSRMTSGLPPWGVPASPVLLTPLSTTPGELRQDACVLHQRTTFQSSQTSSLLSFVAIELHRL